MKPFYCGTTYDTRAKDAAYVDLRLKICLNRLLCGAKRSHDKGREQWWSGYTSSKHIHRGRWMIVNRGSNFINPLAYLVEGYPETIGLVEVSGLREYGFFQAGIEGRDRRIADITPLQKKLYEIGRIFHKIAYARTFPCPEGYPEWVSYIRTAYNRIVGKGIKLNY